MVKAKKLIVPVGASVVSIFTLVLSLHFHSINKELQDDILKVNEKYNDVLITNEELQLEYSTLQVNLVESKDMLNKASATIEQASTENKKLQKDIETLVKQNSILKDKMEQVSNSSTSVSRSQVYTGKKTASATPKANSISMTATYYTAYCNGCTGKTATGDNVKNTIYSKTGHRVIAVDPKVIPLRSLVEVTTPNETFIAVASDTGGAIKGRKIDILVSSKKTALSKGVDQVQIRILK